MRRWRAISQARRDAVRRSPSSTGLPTGINNLVETVDRGLDRDRRGAGGACRDRPHPPHGGRLSTGPSRAQDPTPTRWPTSSARSSSQLAGTPRHAARRRPRNSARAPTISASAPRSRRRPSRRPPRRWSSLPRPCCRTPAAPRRRAMLAASLIAHGGRERRGDGARPPSHGADHRVVGQDLQHHRAHRRHRLPDQSAGAQRLGRSGAGRRGRQGLCGGRGRSAAAGAIGGAGFVRGQGADRAVSGTEVRGGSTLVSKPASKLAGDASGARSSNELMDGIAARQPRSGLLDRRGQQGRCGSSTR